MSGKNFKEKAQSGKVAAVLIITAGNILRSDDGIGHYIAERINNENILVLDAGDKPENIIDKAIQSSSALNVIIDAADFGGKYGEIKVLSYDSIPEKTISTHTFPIKAIAKILMKETGNKVVFIGIQIKETGFGENISAEVKTAGDFIVQLINESKLNKLL